MIKTNVKIFKINELKKNVNKSFKKIIHEISLLNKKVSIVGQIDFNGFSTSLGLFYA